MGRFCFTLCAALLLAAAGPAAEVAPKRYEFTVRNDVTYATVDGQKLQLDIAVPKGDGPFPCVVCLHGGAWKYGSRKDLSRGNVFYDFGLDRKPLIEILAERGFVAATVSYRLAPANKFPAQVQDVKTAIRYLRENAAAYRIDKAKVAACGFSAGGHLAALVGCADDGGPFDGDLYPKQSGRVSCVVNFFGPADLTLYCETPGIEKAYFVPLLGYTSKEKMEAYRKASPVEYVSKDDPPFMLIHGTADLLVPILHSERLFKKLTECGVPTEMLTMPGRGHGWTGQAAADTTEKMIAFLHKQLQGK